jgi:Family of unknown function (DUF6518)
VAVADGTRAAAPVEPTVSSPALAGPLVLAVGLAVGALTSLLQAHLDAPWGSIVNAASPWLTPAFLLGPLWRRPSAAATGGLAVCLLELVGYYVTASARGYPASEAILVFWAVCAAVGGPVLGMSGWLWWRAGGRLTGFGAAVLAAAFFSEALVAYTWRLHYWSSAALFGALGTAAICLLGLRGWQHRMVVRWLVLVLPIGVLAEFALELVYQQSF